MSLLYLLAETFYYKWRTFPSTHVDLRGRVVVVTGANSGLGFEAAKAFYTMNPERMILACRSVEKGEAAKAEILKIVKEDGAP
jgi:NAD(P)-dependent dehydrogenase (short-subunit alcohol dehydrogenase family)